MHNLWEVVPDKKLAKAAVATGIDWGVSEDLIDLEEGLNERLCCTTCGCAIR